MKKLLGNLLITLTAIFLLLVLLPSEAWAERTTVETGDCTCVNALGYSQGSNVSYTVYRDENGVYSVEIEGVNYMKDYKENRPAPWTEYPIVSAKIYGISLLGDYAFANCKYLESVEINALNSNSGLLIEEGVFKNCTSLKSILLPEGVSRIGMNAFLDALL